MILMNGFDCESTVWFNTDWIDHIECIDHHLLKTFARMGDAFF